MLKKSLFLLLSAVAAAFVFSGCVVIKEYTPNAAQVKTTPQELELSKKLLQAFVKNDAATFVALLPEETRRNFNEDNFAKTRKAIIESVGEPVEYSYLTTLELSTLHPQIWKVRFKRWNVNRTKEYTSEILFKVITGMEDKKQAVITGFHFL